jgi:ornithine cyclodeaminase/alanine dehydrogenase-like protein (mu-crystallin family)
MALVLSSEEVAEALDAQGYIEAMEEAFNELGRVAAINSPRTETSIPLNCYTPSLRSEVRRQIQRIPLDADPIHSPEAMKAAKKAKEVIYRLKTMPGGYPKCGVMALRIDSTLDTHPLVNGNLRLVKLPIGPGWRYTGIVLLFSLKTGELLAILPEGNIQKMRVGATTAVGVKYLARKDAAIVGLLGAGTQAESALLTVSQVRRLKRVQVFSPNPDHRRRFAAVISDRIGVEVRPVDRAEEAFDSADVMLTATTSSTAVFKARWLQEGVHLATVNPFETEMKTFSRVDTIVVNVRPFGGGKDLIHDFVLGGQKPLTIGKIMNRRARRLDWDSMAELGELLNGRAKGRRSARDITYHVNNVGLGMQFAAAGARILEEARKKGLGREVPSDWFLQKEHT